MPSLILFMGGLYAIACFQVLLSPGTPASLPYNNGGKTFRIRVENYSVDLEMRQAHLTGLSIEGAKRTIARVSRADIRMVGGTIAVVATQGDMTVEHLGGGSYDIIDLVPGGPPKGEETPFTLAIDSVSITYIDSSKSPQLSTKLLVEGLNVASSGDLSLSHGTVSAPGIRRSELTVQTGSHDLLWVRLQSRNSDYRSALPFITRLVESSSESIPSWTAERFSVDGTIEFLRTADSKPLAYGTVSIEGDSVNLPGYLNDARVRIIASGDSITTNVVANVSQAQDTLSAKGALQWEPSPKLVADARLTSASRRGLPSEITKLLPRDLQYSQLDAKGKVATEGEKVYAQGLFRASRIVAEGQLLSNITTRFVLNDKLLALSSTSGSYENQRFQASGILDLARNSVHARIDARRLDLAKIGQRYDVPYLAGTGDAEILVEGPLARPNVEVFSRGSWLVRDLPQLGDKRFNYTARASIKGDTLLLRQFAGTSQEGNLLARGEANLANRKLAFQVAAENVEVRTEAEGARVLVNGRSSITGTYDAPLITYELAAKSRGETSSVFNDAVVSGTYKNQEIVADRIIATALNGSVFGRASLNVNSGNLRGTFSGRNFRIPDLDTPDVFGTVSVRNGVISGSLEDPIVEATLESNNLYLLRSEASMKPSRFLLKGSTVTVEELQVSVLGGTAEASGTYDIRSKAWSGQGTVTALNLRQVPRDLTADVPLTGALSATFFGAGGAGVSSSGRLEGRLTDLTASGALLGSGTLEANLVGRNLSANGTLGTVERYIELSALNLDTEDRSWTAEALAYNVDLGPLIAASKASWSLEDATLRNTLESLAGNGSGTVMARSSGGSAEIPYLSVTLSDLVVSGRQAGALTLSGSKASTDFDLSSLEWNTGAGLLTANGSLSGDDELTGNVDIVGLDLSWLRTINPEAPLVAGTLSVTATLSGTVKEPVGRASLFASLSTITGKDGEVARIPASVNIDEAVISNKGVDASGKVTYQGFSGTLLATVPFEALAENADSSKKAIVSAEFESRPLEAFRDYITNIRYEESEGTVSGSALYTFDRDTRNLTATARVRATRLSLENPDLVLRDADLELNHENNITTLTANAQSGEKGEIAAEIVATTPSLETAIDGLSTFLAGEIRGNVRVDRLRLSQTLDAASPPTSGYVSTNLTLSGTLGRISTAGSVTLENAQVYPTELATASVSEAPVLEILFDNVAINVGQGSRIVTPVGNLELAGSGVLAGSLANPALDLPLMLQSGELRLPTTSVALQPGGRVRALLSQLDSGLSIPRVDVNLEGTSRIVARSPLGQFEPYRIDLSIRGNLLDGDSLVITGVSDPPGLSTSEILAVLGQRDLVEGLAGTTFGGGDRDGFLRETAYSIAVPALTRGISNEVMKAIGLDFLEVTYNPLQGFVLNAGKLLSKQLVLEAVQELERRGGTASNWELRLSYRPPFAAFLGRTRLSLAVTNTVPWRLSISWSRRF
ncbi:MAG: hypothetical protein KIT11_08285 [Fimbriimonadaceae bacterium]|nr:hypothetical protein [Fimbriimonadaceae bacterium]